MTMRAMQERSRWCESGRKANRQRGNGRKVNKQCGMDVEMNRMLRERQGIWYEFEYNTSCSNYCIGL